jgi:hypothetical protein
MAASNAAENGRNATIDGNFVSFPDQDDDGATDAAPKNTGSTELPALSDEDFQKKAEGWKKAIAAGKAANDVIATAATKNTLTDEQKVEIASWAVKTTGGAEA